jgi:hypothetical protein
MRKLLIIASFTIAGITVTGCNPPPLRAVPPQHQQQQACNCKGTDATSGQGEDYEHSVPPSSSLHSYARMHYRKHGYRSNDRAYNGSYEHHDRYEHDGSYERDGRHEHDGSYERHGRDEHGDSDERDGGYSRADYSSYSYRSSSRVYRMDEGYVHAGAYTYGSSDRDHDARGHHEHGDAYAGDANQYDSDEWQDGYGRTHSTRLNPKAERARMDPWHGYDVDCDRDRRH